MGELYPLPPSITKTGVELEYPRWIQDIIGSGGSLSDILFAVVGGLYDVVMATIDSESLDGLSDIIDLGYGKHFALVMPNAWDDAVITIQGSADGVLFQDLYDDLGGEVVITAKAETTISLKEIALDIAPFRFIKLRSGTSDIPVPQSADREIKIICSR